MASRSPFFGLSFSGSSTPRERRGLRVRNLIDVESGGGTFTYSDDLKQATAVPPLPFAGEATYARHRLHSELTFEPLHGPTATIGDGKAFMRRVRGGSYSVYLCPAPAPGASRLADAARASQILERLAPGR